MDDRTPGAPTPAFAEWLRRHDAEMRIILAEMAESAGQANALWTYAVVGLSKNPDHALSRMVDLEVLLESILRPQVRDTLSIVRRATKRLAAELPDDEDDDPSRAAI